MKVFKSIKWRLQLWYGLILVVVLAGFGGTTYQLERGRQMRQVDEEIRRRVAILASNLRRPPPRPANAGEPFGNRPSPQEQFPPEQFPEGGPPQFQRRPAQFRLAQENAALFGTNDTRDFFFIIRRVVEGDDSVIARSDNFPPQDAAAMEFDRYLKQVNRLELPARKKISPPKYFQLRDRQMIVEILPSSEAVAVGCSLKPLRAELRSTARNLFIAGGLILVVGLAGGWWFVGRALRPVSEISATATKISSGDLSQRINALETESELGQLVAVLNSTFARLETAFAQQKQFASDAAHELRTPVTVILTQTQLALSRDRDAAGYKQTVEACQRAAQRMRRLIESLLELARFDAGQEILKRMRFDLARCVAESVELVQTLAEEKRVTIFSELQPGEITGDPERLAQVVTNLLTNAIQYNQPNGEVRVRLEAREGLMVLEIADTGPGITPEDLPRVFERFYRGDKSRTGAGNSGLGLAICKAIVEAHGGSIEAASELGAGTAFTVRLPV